MQHYSAASCGVLYIDSILYTAVLSTYIDVRRSVPYIDRCTLQCSNIDCFTLVYYTLHRPLYLAHSLNRLLYYTMFLI